MFRRKKKVCEFIDELVSTLASTLYDEDLRDLTYRLVDLLEEKGIISSYIIHPEPVQELEQE